MAAVATGEDIPYSQLRARKAEPRDAPVQAELVSLLRDLRHRSLQAGAMKRGALSRDEDDDYVLDEDDEDSGVPKRRRRSTRAVPGSKKDLSWLSTPTRRQGAPSGGKKEKRNGLVQKSERADYPYGPKYQADVPAKPIFSDPSQVVENPDLKLVFSCGRPGDENVKVFLRAMNQASVRRDGFPLSPMNEERALEAYWEKRGVFAQGDIRCIMGCIPRVRRFPHGGVGWSESEQCLLERTLAERERDFSAISRHVMPGRTTKELVVHYYTRYKQRPDRSGRGKQGLVFDHGTEKPPHVRLGPDLQVQYLRNLARTAGDGFPPERRMRDALLESRDDKVGALIRRRSHAAGRERQRLMLGLLNDF